MVGAIVVLLRMDDDNGPQSIVVSPLGLKAGQSERLYPENDPWKAYLAPESICPGGEDRSAPMADQLGRWSVSSIGPVNDAAFLLFR